MPGRKSTERKAKEKVLLEEQVNIIESYLIKLRQPEYCDVALKAIPIIASSDDEKSVYGHKCILEAASPYFNNLFSSNPGHRFSIEGMNRATLEFLLNCIYKCYVAPIDENNMFAICRGAKILQLPDVQAACEEFIDESRKIDNCLEIWLFGKKEECTSLTDTSFITQHLKDVANLEQFIELTSEELRGLMSTRPIGCSSDDMLVILYKWFNGEKDEDKKKSRIESFLSLVRELPQNEINHKVFATVLLGDRLLKEDVECQKFRDEYCKYNEKKSSSAPLLKEDEEARLLALRLHDAETQDIAF